MQRDRENTNAAPNHAVKPSTAPQPQDNLTFLVLAAAALVAGLLSAARTHGAEIPASEVSNAALPICCQQVESAVPSHSERGNDLLLVNPKKNLTDG